MADKNNCGMVCGVCGTFTEGGEKHACQEEVGMKIEEIAAVCHEANRAYCCAIGDDSQVSWEDAPAWQRDSAVNGVKFHRENPDAGPSGSHQSWLDQKREEGWKYGPVKDVKNKEHPCFVEYQDLPEEQQVKDYLFIAIVKALSGARFAARHDIRGKLCRYFETHNASEFLQMIADAESEVAGGNRQLEYLGELCDPTNLLLGG